MAETQQDDNTGSEEHTMKAWTVDYRNEDGTVTLERSGEDYRVVADGINRITTWDRLVARRVYANAVASPITSKLRVGMAVWPPITSSTTFFPVTITHISEPRKMASDRPYYLVTGSFFDGEELTIGAYADQRWALGG